MKPRDLAAQLAAQGIVVETNKALRERAAAGVCCVCCNSERASSGECACCGGYVCGTCGCLHVGEPAKRCPGDFGDCEDPGRASTATSAQGGPDGPIHDRS